MNKIIVVGILFFLLSIEGTAQNFSFEPRIVLGGGYTSWFSRYPLQAGIQIDGEVYYEIVGKGNGGNISIQCLPIFKLKNFMIGPNLGFQEYFVEKISFNLINFEREADFKKVFKIGILFGYDFNLLEKKKILISPLITVGVHTFKSKDEPLDDDSFRNKFYGSLGIGFSKIINSWKVTISPSYDIVMSDFRFDSQDYLEMRVHSLNFNVGIGYIIKLK